jgi:hypothetical protein
MSRTSLTNIAGCGRIAARGPKRSANLSGITRQVSTYWL